MTLTIKVKNLEHNEAAELTKFTSDMAQRIARNRLGKPLDQYQEDPEVVFDYGNEDLPVPYIEETPFSRYMNSTKKE